MFFIRLILACSFFIFSPIHSSVLHKDVKFEDSCTFAKTFTTVGILLTQREDGLISKGTGSIIILNNCPVILTAAHVLENVKSVTFQLDLKGFEMYAQKANN